MRIIDKHTAFSMNLESIITSHDANVYQVWLCLLSEITILERFLKDRLLRICDTNLRYDWVFFRWKIWRRNENTFVCTVFFYKTLCIKNFKNLHFIRNFSFFYIWKCVNWLSETFLKKLKSVLNILLLEIIADNGVVNRRVLYFLHNRFMSRTISCVQTYSMIWYYFYFSLNLKSLNWIIAVNWKFKIHVQLHVVNYTSV